FLVRCVFLDFLFVFFFQAEDGIRDRNVTGVQTCALPISSTTRSPISTTISADRPRRPTRMLSLRARPRSHRFSPWSPPSPCTPPPPTSTATSTTTSTTSSPPSDSPPSPTSATTTAAASSTPSPHAKPHKPPTTEGANHAIQPPQARRIRDRLPPRRRRRLHRRNRHHRRRGTHQRRRRRTVD